MFKDSLKNGGLTFNRANSKFGYKVQMPCRKCIGCRLDYSREWAIRNVHESYMHDENCFITLTYNNDHLPPDNSLVKKHFQEFIRSLRKRTGIKIRYYMCGEYGDLKARPHYHALLFGYSFPDKTLSAMRRGLKNYRSDLLEETWTKGFSEIADFNYANAAYTSRYIMKKQYGVNADIQYGTSYDIVTRKKIHTIQPEYVQQSLKPGIGKPFYDRYFSDLFPVDEIHMNGKTFPMPSYYHKLLAIDDPELAEKLLVKRVAKLKSLPINERRPKRLAVKEFCQIQKLKQLTRTLE